MKVLVIAIMAIMALVSCVDTPLSDGAAPAADTNWVGEVRMTKGDTTIRLCGTGRTYKLSGPDMDTLTARYVHARMSTGQTMKVWCYGHIGAITKGTLVDSTLFAVKFQHLDASLRCDPIPDPRVSGNWKLDDLDPLYPREINLQLYENGAALMITDLRNGRPAFEEDGTWGMDADNVVNVAWPQRQHTMLFTWEGDALINTNGPPGKRIAMRKIGPADRTVGAFGRAARWLAGTATAHGRPTTIQDLRPSTTIAELFASPAAMEALKSQALDTFAVHHQSGALRLEAMKTVRDYALLLRATPRR
jgi:hypothetical protein